MTRRKRLDSIGLLITLGEWNHRRPSRVTLGADPPSDWNELARR